jgi:hypothetical protein
MAFAVAGVTPRVWCDLLDEQHAIKIKATLRDLLEYVLIKRNPERIRIWARSQQCPISTKPVPLN